MTAAQTPSTPSVHLDSEHQPPTAPPAPAVRPPLRRSYTDKMVGGVCGGLGEHTGIDSLVWRVGFVGLTLAGGAGVLVYLLLWVLMPPAPARQGEAISGLEELVQRLHGSLVNAGMTSPRQ